MQQFKLPQELECLFTVEMTENNSKGKEHLAVIKGETLSIIVASHTKLPRGKYLAEKKDGTRECTIQFTLWNERIAYVPKYSLLLF